MYVCMYVCMYDYALVHVYYVYIQRTYIHHLLEIIIHVQYIFQLHGVRAGTHTPSLRSSHGEQHYRFAVLKGRLHVSE